VDARERTELVERGAFRWVRNPIFSWMLVALIGLVVIVPSGWSITAFVTLLAAVQLQVRCVEEPYLLATHGARYADYAARTGRFVPFVGRT